MNWLRITSARSGVYAIEEPGHVVFYLVNGRSHTALIDTGMGFTSLRHELRSLLRPNVMVLNTHWHYDHVGGNHEFDHIGISTSEANLIGLELPNSLLQTICLQPAVADGTPLPDSLDHASYHIPATRPSFTIAEGDIIDLGGRTLEAIATPGHSRGSLSFFDSHTGDLFIGDLVYRSDIYWQFAESDLDEAIGSLQKLLARQSDFRRLWPCHGLTHCRHLFCKRHSMPPKPSATAHHRMPSSPPLVTAAACINLLVSKSGQSSLANQEQIW